MNRDWKYYFYEISNIPRKSGNEEMIKEYLEKFATERNFEYYTDEQNNVIIWKKANGKTNNDEVIGLQAHVDMVCEKAKHSSHDFNKDTIQIIEENGVLKAKDTSLGADNGIGIAYILAILDSTIIKHPKLEAIFTTQEETTMNGVRHLDGSKIRSKKIISFDNFNEKELWIGSASSQEWYTRFKTNMIEQDDVETFKLSLNNFVGGHAGMDIGDEKRGNPIKIAFCILKETKIYINYIKAGSLINVIPRDCDIIFSIKNDNNEDINIIKKNIKHLKEKYVNEHIEIKRIKKHKCMMDDKSSYQIINCINEFEIGAINRDDNGNVIVGVNLSKIECDKENVKLDFGVRGNRRNLTNIYVQNLKEKIIKKYNLNIDKYDEWYGYEQSIDNDLIKMCEEAYIKVKNDKPNILAVQACLECEFLGLKIKELQYVALGTNTFDVHSVSERIEIKSIERTWKIILEILKMYYERS